MEQREGEPVLVLVAAHIKDGQLKAGMVFARSELEAGVYAFTPAGKPEHHPWYIRLTPDAVNLPRDGWAANVDLEVVAREQEQKTQ